MSSVRSPRSRSVRGRHGARVGLAALAALVYVSTIAPAAAGTSAVDMPATHENAAHEMVVPAPGANEAGLESLAVSRSLGLTTARDMVVDRVNGRVYVSGDDRVVVTDLEGFVVQSLTGHPGAADMVIGGSSLYVLRSDNTIGTIQLGASATNGPSITLSAGYASNLGYGAGALWIARGDYGGYCGSLAIARVALDGTVTTFTGDLEGLSCPLLAVQGNTMVVADRANPQELRRYDLSTDPPTMTANATVTSGRSLASLHISEDGATVYASRGPSALTETWTLPALSPGPSYTVPGSATFSDSGVVGTSSAQGGLVAIARGGSPDLALFTAGDPASPRWVGTGRSDSVPIALEFGAGGTTLFVLDFVGSLTVVDAAHPNSRFGEFHPIDPARVFDSRGSGIVGQFATVKLTGNVGVPASNVSAVAVNITVTDPASAGYVTVWPAGSAQPNASSLNFRAGQTIPNMAIVGLGQNGELSFFTSAPTHLLIDVVGWFGDHDAPAGGRFHPTLPFRWFDTRLDPRGDGSIRPLGPNDFVFASATNETSAANMNRSALALNVTATNTTSQSYLTVTPFGAPLRSSNLNWKAGEVVPNAVISKIDPTRGRVQFTNSSGTTDVIVDSTGYWDDGTLPSGSTFRPVNPTRLVDTRSGYLAPGSVMGTALHVPAHGLVSFKANGDLPRAATTAVLNVTAVGPTAPGYISVFPLGQEVAQGVQTSLVNFSPGDVRPNMTIMPMGLGGEIVVVNMSDGPIDILVDITGYFA